MMKLLVAEDDASTRLLLRVTLRKLGYDVLAVENGQQAWDAFREGGYRILISDWNMPDMTGLDLCRKIRSHPAQEYTYLFLLTAYNGKNHFLDAIGAGVDDFMSKPFDKEVLAARLHVAQRILDLQKTLQFQASHDLHTGIWNRSAMLDFLAQELDRAQRENKSIGVVLADLDRFKRVNDTYGHQAGDEVLNAAAERFKGVLRPYDRIGRYGGEEFLMVLPGCDGPSAVHVAERMRQSLGECAVPTADGEIRVTASLGVTASGKDRPCDVDSLIREADRALYRAKRAGRNRIALHTHAAADTPVQALLNLTAEDGEASPALPPRPLPGPSPRR